MCVCVGGATFSYPAFRFPHVCFLVSLRSGKGSSSVHQHLTSYDCKRKQKGDSDFESFLQRGWTKSIPPAVRIFPSPTVMESELRTSNVMEGVTEKCSVTRKLSGNGGSHEDVRAIEYGNCTRASVGLSRIRASNSHSGIKNRPQRIDSEKLELRTSR